MEGKKQKMPDSIKIYNSNYWTQFFKQYFTKVYKATKHRFFKCPLKIAMLIDANSFWITTAATVLVSPAREQPAAG